MDRLHPYGAVRAATEALCSGLPAEDLVVQSMPDASPLKWHLAHTSWFFENFVLAGDGRYRPFHPRFNFLFNSYYEAVGERWQRAERGVLSRPTVDEVRAYRRHVDGHLRELLPRVNETMAGVIELGLHHEEQHQELILTDVKHMLSLNPLEPIYRDTPRATALETGEPPPLHFIGFDEGIRECGFDGDGFAFDNERPRHRQLQPAFAIASRLTSAGEFLDFIADGGYTRPELWLSDGWAAVQQHGWRAPLYWRRGDGNGSDPNSDPNSDDDWHCFTLGGWRRVARGEPVCHVSYLRSRRLRALGRRPPADGARVGDGLGARVARQRQLRRERPLSSRDRARRRPCADVRRGVAVDRQRLLALPRLSRAARRARRIQRQVHVQPAGAARRLVRHAPTTHARHLPQLLPCRRPLAIFGPSAGERRDMMNLARTTLPSRFTLIDADREARVSDFADEVRDGLSARRKRLSCRHLYDAAGSQLFEEICALPEYYLTRAELSILRAHAGEIAQLCDRDTALVELGSGSSTKTRTLIEALLERHGRLRYVPIDISRSMLADSSRALLDDYPALEIVGVAAEYRAGLELLRDQRDQAKLILWLGSNVGNFQRGEAARFLRSLRATMGARDRLLVGIDLRKAASVLEPAYDDAAGVTARFNLNLLARINRELDGEFDLSKFTHQARWNDHLGRMEMHLVSRAKQRVSIGALGLQVQFADGERIHTECSYKYSPRQIDRLASDAGLVIERRWLDDKKQFSVNLMAPLSA